MDPGANFPTMDWDYTMFAVGGQFLVVVVCVIQWAVKKSGGSLEDMGDDDLHMYFDQDDFGDSGDD